MHINYEKGDTYLPYACTPPPPGAVFHHARPNKKWRYSLVFPPPNNTLGNLHLRGPQARLPRRRPRSPQPSSSQPSSRAPSRTTAPTAPERLPLPAPVAMFILEGAEHMPPLVQWDPLDPRLQLLRASIAFISSYIFFNRGECSAICLAEDMVVTIDHITLRP